MARVTCWILSATRQTPVCCVCCVRCVDYLATMGQVTRQDAMDTIDASRQRLDIARACLDVVFVLVTEEAQGGVDGWRHAFAQRAEAGAADPSREALQQGPVLHAPLAAEHAVQSLSQPHRPFAAGRALAAGFIPIEFHGPWHDRHHTGGAVHGGRAAPPSNRAT